MSARIDVIGSNMVDLVTTIDRMPELGETVEAPRFAIGAGGKGANQAAAAAKLGASVVMVSRVGDDTLRNFAALGIDKSHVRIVPGTSSGVAPIFVDARGDNRILIVKGANDHLLPADIDEAAPDLLGCGLMAWFRIRPFWVTRGAQKPPACEGRISAGRVFCAGGGQPPRVKLAGAEAVPGPAG